VPLERVATTELVVTATDDSFIFPDGHRRIAGDAIDFGQLDGDAAAHPLRGSQLAFVRLNVTTEVGQTFVVLDVFADGASPRRYGLGLGACPARGVAKTRTLAPAGVVGGAGRWLCCFRGGFVDLIGGLNAGCFLDALWFAWARGSRFATFTRVVRVGEILVIVVIDAFRPGDALVVLIDSGGVYGIKRVFKRQRFDKGRDSAVNRVCDRWSATVELWE
jgi:hypothetical protein